MPPFLFSVTVSINNLIKIVIWDNRMKVRELLREKMNNWIGRYSKGVDKFILWQDNHYYYSLKQSAQSPGGSFKIIKNFDDMSLEEVKDWLSGAGYKEDKTVKEGDEYLTIKRKLFKALNKGDIEKLLGYNDSALIRLAQHAIDELNYTPTQRIKEFINAWRESHNLRR